VRSTVGIHPHDAGVAQSSDIGKLALLAEENSELVVGFGEIGLDYVKKYSPPDIQRSMFRTQLGTAKDLGLPIIIHDREAHDDCLRILKETGPFDNGGVMHCFSGNLEFARKVIDLNLHISIPGIVTFKNAKDIQEAAAHLPLDMMLLETDGPFLAPVPFRGKRNEPCFTLFTAASIAKIKNISIEEVAEQTSKNACSLFRTSFNSEQ
jgi:TatD DNase family protein